MLGRLNELLVLFVNETPVVLGTSSNLSVPFSVQGTWLTPLLCFDNFCPYSQRYLFSLISERYSNLNEPSYKSAWILWPPS